MDGTYNKVRFVAKADYPNGYMNVAIEALPGRSVQGTITRFAHALDEATKTMLAEIDLETDRLAQLSDPVAKSHGAGNLTRTLRQWQGACLSKRLVRAARAQTAALPMFSRRSSQEMVWLPQ